MIKADKKSVEIVGNGADIMVEFGCIARSLAMSFDKAGIDLERAKADMIDLVEMAFGEEKPPQDGWQKKDVLDEAGRLLEEVLKKLKGGHE